LRFGQLFDDPSIVRVVDRFEKPYDTGDVDWKGEKIFGLEPLVIMEFVANGDLERLIHRMIDPLDFIEKRLPDRVLWRIFMDREYPRL
jgi:hypothetical protein